MSSLLLLCFAVQKYQRASPWIQCQANGSPVQQQKELEAPNRRERWFSPSRLVIAAREACHLRRCHRRLVCASQAVAQSSRILFQSLEQDKPLPAPEWDTEIQRCLGTGFLLASLICLSLIAEQKLVSGLAEENDATVTYEASTIISAATEIRVCISFMFILISLHRCYVWMRY